MSFQLAEKALRALVDAAVIAGDHEASKRLGEALETVLSVGGWRAFPVAAPASDVRSKSANALRQERYRAAKRNAQSVTSSVTSNVTRNAQSVTDGVTGVLSLSSSGSENIEKEAEKEEQKREESARDVTRDASPTSVTQKASRTSRDTRGTRCTMDYEPRPETVETLKRQGHKDPLSLLQDFRLYWVPLTGANATKLDWDLTFTRWVQRERPRNTSSTFVRHVQPSENRAWKLPEGAE